MALSPSQEQAFSKTHHNYIYNVLLRNALNVSYYYLDTI